MAATLIFPSLKERWGLVAVGMAGFIWQVGALGATLGPAWLPPFEVHPENQVEDENGM